MDNCVNEMCCKVNNVECCSKCKNRDYCLNKCPRAKWGKAQLCKEEQNE